MPQTIEDILANDYVTQTSVKKIDHGLAKPRPGGHTIVRDLQKDLLKEQDDIHGGSRAAKTQKWASPNRLLSTSDLYSEMVNSGGFVAATRGDIVDEESELTVVGDKVFTERFYSAQVTYHIDVAGLLNSMDEFDPIVHRQASAYLSENPGDLTRYIRSNGAEGLLDRWLPANRQDEGYDLRWEIVDTSYRAVDYVDIVVYVRERHLIGAVGA